MKFRIFCLIWSSIGFLQLQAQSLEQTLEYGNKLYEQHYYDQAIPVFERVLFFGNRQTTPEVTFRLARSYQETNQFEKALAYYDEAYQLSKDADLKMEVSFQKALLYLSSNNPGFALLELLSIQADTNEDMQMRKLFFLGATRLKMEHYSLAEKHFRDYFILSGQESALPILEERFKDTLDIHRINPKLAAYMSLIIPGSGQLYAHAYKEALNSFLLVGGLEVLFIFTAGKVSLLDAYLSVFPWWQRYYGGGFKGARKAAENRKVYLKNQLYANVLQEAYQLHLPK